MRFTWIILVAVVVLQQQRCGVTGQCSDGGAYDFSLTVTSRSNSTRHRIFKATAEISDSEFRHSLPVTLDIGHHQLGCGKSRSAQMTVTATMSPQPPPGYEMVNGLGFYKMHTTALRWEDARDKCVQEGAHLLMINSDEEAEVVRTYFVRKPKILNLTENTDAYLYTHVGFHDRYVEGKYITLTGQPLNQSGYVRWDVNKPNNRNDHNCGFANKDVRYHDGPCQWQQFYICEFEQLD